MMDFIFDLARSLVSIASVVGAAFAEFFRRLGHEWSLAWVPIVVAVALVAGLLVLKARD